VERALGALTGQRDDYETIRGLVCLRHPYGVKPRGLHNALLEGVGTGDIRTDVPSDELANYCLHALTAAGRLPSKAAVHSARLGHSGWAASGPVVDGRE